MRRWVTVDRAHTHPPSPSLSQHNRTNGHVTGNQYNKIPTLTSLMILLSSMRGLDRYHWLGEDYIVAEILIL